MQVQLITIPRTSHSHMSACAMHPVYLRIRTHVVNLALNLSCGSAIMCYNK